jgi:radical SAM superfamily enzyme YgiQ (UPF0313 family)
MADILLTHCNHLYYDQKQVRKMQPYPPLQTILAAAVLRHEGLDVAFFDATLTPPEEGFRLALTHHNPRLVVICEDNFNFLTKMCLKRNRDLAIAMAGIARERDVPVLVCSSDASDRPGAYLSNGLDVVIVGEVETTLVEATHHLLDGSCIDLSRIRGLAYRDTITGDVRYSPPRQPLKELGRLPMAAWDLVEMSDYRGAWSEAHGFFSLNMVSSRGCPYHCNWCAKPVYGQTYRFMPPQRVAQEMHYLKETFGPDQIWFADDIFALSSQWTDQFAGAVERLGAQVPFKMQSRCDLMTRGTVAALKRAGCAEVWMGAESGSQQILDAMEKGIRVEQIYLARENLRNHGIRTCYFLQFGYPGETWEDIQSTIRMVRETAPDGIGISVSYPLPGTKFYSRVAAELGSKQNWSDSGDLSMMFQGTYTSEFYAALHDALHFEVDLRNGNSNGSTDQQRLRGMWSRVQELETTCANPKSLALWTCS